MPSSHPISQNDARLPIPGVLACGEPLQWNGFGTVPHSEAVRHDPRRVEQEARAVAKKNDENSLIIRAAPVAAY